MTRLEPEFYSLSAWKAKWVKISNSIRISGYFWYPKYPVGITMYYNLWQISLIGSLILVLSFTINNLNMCLHLLCHHVIVTSTIRPLSSLWLVESVNEFDSRILLMFKGLSIFHRDLLISLTLTEDHWPQTVFLWTRSIPRPGN